MERSIEGARGAQGARDKSKAERGREGETEKRLRGERVKRDRERERENEGERFREREREDFSSRPRRWARRCARARAKSTPPSTSRHTCGSLLSPSSLLSTRCFFFFLSCPSRCLYITSLSSYSHWYFRLLFLETESPLRLAASQYAQRRLLWEWLRQVPLAPCSLSSSSCSASLSFCLFPSPDLSAFSDLSRRRGYEHRYDCGRESQGRGGLSLWHVPGGGLGSSSPGRGEIEK